MQDKLTTIRLTQILFDKSKPHAKELGFGSYSSYIRYLVQQDLNNKGRYNNERRSRSI